MTAPDPRLDVIGDRLEAAKYHGAPAFMIPTQDVRYLLAELRKAHEALERVAELHTEDIFRGHLSNGCKTCGNVGDAGYPCPTAAAVAAAKGDEQ